MWPDPNYSFILTSTVSQSTVTIVLFKFEMRSFVFIYLFFSNDDQRHLLLFWVNYIGLYFFLHLYLLYGFYESLILLFFLSNYFHYVHI